MPPKKDAAGGDSADLITGFTDKECKLLAAAFISSTAPDKYDYDLMATLTKNTAGSLKKMWPPVKRKAIEAHDTFGAFLGQAATGAANGDAKPAPAPKTTTSRKRKAADEKLDEASDDQKANEPTSAQGNKSDDNKSDGNKSDTKKKAAPKKKAPAKKRVKKEEPTSDDEAKLKSGDDSADGGDGLAMETED